jgi:hypothetical protein
MSENVLTPKQRRALAALLASPTLAAAAAIAGVNVKTLTRWLTQPAFIAGLKEAQTSVIDAAGRRLLQGLDQALDTLSNLMISAESESVKRAAASEWLANCLTVREQTDLEKRLIELEKAAIR